MTQLGRFGRFLCFLGSLISFLVMLGGPVVLMFGGQFSSDFPAWDWEKASFLFFVGALGMVVSNIPYFSHARTHLLSGLGSLVAFVLMIGAPFLMVFGPLFNSSLPGWDWGRFLAIEIPAILGLVVCNLYRFRREPCQVVSEPSLDEGLVQDAMEEMAKVALMGLAHVPERGAFSGTKQKAKDSLIERLRDLGISEDGMKEISSSWEKAVLRFYANAVLKMAVHDDSMEKEKVSELREMLKNGCPTAYELGLRLETMGTAADGDSPYRKLLDKMKHFEDYRQISR